ncbi:MAG TPA: EAL domain-containing response regulator [Nocardioidaceae bacterium]|nr:EAL domain-containing response regulator [Nocardioidaceae bacterium]
MSVLIVDDSSLNLDLLRTVLEQEGLGRVTIEADSRKVAARLPEVRPDLVLLDLHMPHLDGHAVLEQIVRFAAGSYLPVLVLTADTAHEARNRALENGARDFLIKPFDLVEVLLRIANLLETRQLYSAMLSAGDRVASAAVAPLNGTEGRVRDVLENRSLAPVYQRVADLTTMETVGFEALTRFAEPHVRGPVGWFGDAFDVGLGIELEWLAAVSALPFADDLPVGSFLAVNMSPATILELQDRELCRPDLIPRMVIEITEHVPVQDYSAVERAMREMRSHGMRLAADDLGTGYAGFHHLVALEPDIIKLDISLVAGIDRGRGRRALATALVAFAKDVGATVIAEGVETEAELAVLQELEVPWAQGFLLGRPERATPGGLTL